MVVDRDACRSSRNGNQPGRRRDAGVVRRGARGLGVFNIVRVYRRGQTWGKKVMGIRIVRTDGHRRSFARFF